MPGMPSACDESTVSGMTGSCGPAGAAGGTTTTSSDQPSAAPVTSGSDDPMGFDPGMTDSGAQTVRATGLHVVFTQPVDQSGVPAQTVEHILGEVFVDSLAVPAGPPPKLGSSSSSSSSSSSCLGAGRSGSAASGGFASGGSSSAGGSLSSGSLSPSGSAFGSASQPGPGATGTSLPAAFAAALRKPLWLLLAYVLWQTLVIGTGVSLWSWRRGDT
jgi:hypothetical protein